MCIAVCVRKHWGALSLHVNMCVCMQIAISGGVCISTSRCSSMCARTKTCVSTYIFSCVDVHMCMCTHTFMCVFAFVWHIYAFCIHKRVRAHPVETFFFARMVLFTEAARVPCHSCVRLCSDTCVYKNIHACPRANIFASAISRT